jgi:hypothetical protein
VRVVELSNHPGDMLGDAARRRQAAEKRVLSVYEDYGNLVEQRPVADRMGRSPSVQLNEPADDLVRFLAERGRPAEIQRVVVLTHRRSGLGRVRNPTVLALTSPGDLLTLIGNSASRLDPGQRAAIGALIRRDHEFHGKRRRTGRHPRR